MTIAVREVLHLLLEADDYPRQGNQDWPYAAALEAEALRKAASAVGSPSDPPEFQHWLNALRRPNITSDEREDIYVAIRDHLDPESRERP